MTVACVIIASAKRTKLLDESVVPSALAQAFDEVVVVGDYHPGLGYRYLAVPPLAKNTNDALVKRDVGTLATTSDWLFYLCDDHAVRKIGNLPNHWLDVEVPARFTTAEGQRIALNMGLDPRDQNAPYCGGHAGLFSRKLITIFPWSAQPHHPLWDLLSSRSLAAFGARIGGQLGWDVEDMEPEQRPGL